MFESESARRLVADFSRAEVLDGAWIYVAGVESPLVAVSGEVFERCAIETNECFLDYGLVGTVAVFDVHHHGDGYTAGEPLNGGFYQVANRRHVACYAGVDKASGIEAQSIAVVGIEVGGVGATAFVAEEVVEGREFAFEHSLFGELGKAFANHFAEEFFSFDERHLHVAVGVAVEHKLASHSGRQSGYSGGVFCAELVENEFFQFFSSEALDFFLVESDDVVEFFDEFFDSGNELDEAFGDEHNTEVFAIVGASHNGLSDGVNHLVEGQILCFNFFGDDAHVGLGLECTFQGDMACGAAHKFDEVPVFASGVSIALDVTNHFGIGLTSRVETE